MGKNIQEVIGKILEGRDPRSVILGSGSVVITSADAVFESLFSSVQKICEEEDLEGWKKTFSYNLSQMKKKDPSKASEWIKRNWELIKTKGINWKDAMKSIVLGLGAADLVGKISNSSSDLSRWIGLS